MIFKVHIDNRLAFQEGDLKAINTLLGSFKFKIGHIDSFSIKSCVL